MFVISSSRFASELQRWVERTKKTIQGWIYRHWKFAVVLILTYHLIYSIEPKISKTAIKVEVNLFKMLHQNRNYIFWMSPIFTLLQIWVEMRNSDKKNGLLFPIWLFPIFAGHLAHDALPKIFTDQTFCDLT